MAGIKHNKFVDLDAWGCLIAGGAGRPGDLSGYRSEKSR